MIWLRSLVFAVVFYINTALFLLLGSPLLLGPRRYAMMGLRAHARASLWWLRVIVGTRLEVRGREHLPAAPVLIAAKHQSAWDTFALITLLGDPAMVMKAELGWIPFYGWFSHKFRHIFVQRERGPSALKTLIRDARDRAADGREIVIFPEGTRRPPGAPPDYKPGVVAVYEALALPCVPLALNSGVFWPRRQMIRHPGTIVVQFLPPIPPGLARREFRAALVEAIEPATARLVAEAGATGTGPLVAVEAAEKQ
ncbi:MAG: 1-acyl-sn-glycerol-3-phosphate acyltransferase [Hyphomicrobiaceae bacterium]|nr:1-acyl-sn-glycerol-3-phosphate acyltransferase [Hyphomicrobiaceae bacterium]